MTIAKAAAANTDEGNYPAVADINAAEPQYTIAAAPSTGPDEVSAVVSTNERTLTLAAKSASGTCWVVVTPLDSSTTYARYEVDADSTDADGACAVHDVADWAGGTGNFDAGDIDGTGFGTASELEVEE